MQKFNRLILRRILKYSSWLLKPYDNYLVRKNDITINKPVVFIIGAPRTGSTILYQLLTSYLNLYYIDNLIHLGREIPFISFLLSKKLYKQKGHFSFYSDYGDTYNQGLHAPSEAGQLWRKWMPEKEHYIRKEDIDEKKLRGFTAFINALSNKTQLPVIVKNLYFSQRLRFLKEASTNCKFIYLKRNPVYTAQSIYVARKKNKPRVTDWWSVEPSNYNEIKNLEVFEQIASQVYYIEKQIENDLKLFNTNNILTLWYEDLNKPTVFLDKIKKFIGANYRSKETPLPNIKIQNYKKISDSDFDQIEQEVKKLYGNKNL